MAKVLSIEVGREITISAVKEHQIGAFIESNIN